VAGNIFLVMAVGIIVVVIGFMRRQGRQQVRRAAPGNGVDWREGTGRFFSWVSCQVQERYFLLVCVAGWIIFLLLVGQIFPKFWDRMSENKVFFTLFNLAVLGVAALLDSGGTSGRKILGWSLVGLVFLAVLGTALGNKPEDVEAYFSKKFAETSSSNPRESGNPLLLSYTLCDGKAGPPGVSDPKALPPADADPSLCVPVQVRIAERNSFTAINISFDNSRASRNASSGRLEAVSYDGTSFVGEAISENSHERPPTRRRSTLKLEKGGDGVFRGVYENYGHPGKFSQITLSPR
jgi:hypothetical protein